MFPFTILPVALVSRLHEVYHGSDGDAVDACIIEILEHAFGDGEEDPPEPRAVHYWESLEDGGHRYAVDGGWLYFLPTPGFFGWLRGSLPPIFIKEEEDFLSDLPRILKGVMGSLGLPMPVVPGEEGTVLSMVRPADEEPVGDDEGTNEGSTLPISRGPRLEPDA